MASTDDALYFRLCLSTTHLTSRCNLVADQCRTILINQHNGNLLDLPYCELISRTASWEGPPDHQGGRVLAFITYDAVMGTAAARPLSAKQSLRATPSDRQESEHGGPTGAASRKHRPSSGESDHDNWTEWLSLDEIDQDKPIRVMATNVAAQFPPLLDSVPLNDDSGDIASWHTPTTRSGSPFDGSICTWHR